MNLLEQRIDEALGINEAGVSRRQFMRYGSSLMSSLATGGLKGVADEALQSLGKAQSEGRPVWLTYFAATGIDPRATSIAAQIKDIRQKFTSLKRAAGDLPIHLASGSESIEFAVQVKPEQLGELIAKIGEVDYADEDYIQIESGKAWVDLDEELQKQIDIMDTNLDQAGLIESWWENWGKWGDSYLDKATAARLARAGIDPKRPNIDGPGLNDDYIRKYKTGSAEPEEWEYQFDKDLQKAADDRARDEKLANPMHQAFENKLNEALGLLGISSNFAK